MTITAEQIFLLNSKSGSIARKVQLGTLIANAESVAAAEIALASGTILIGTAGGVGAAQTMSGDATISASGVLTIAALAVSSGKIAANAVVLSKLAAGITPGLLVMAAGIFTTLGGDANESITVAGALGTDTALVWVQKAGGTPRTVDTITPGTGAIAVVLSGDPSTDHKLAYIVYRAPA